MKGPGARVLVSALVCALAASQSVFFTPRVALDALRHHWEFEGTNPLNDRVGSAHLSIVNPARASVGGGQLSVSCDSGTGVGGYAQSAVGAVTGVTYTDKTLEMWVSVNPLTQRNGGVMSLAIPGTSEVFDGVSYAEGASNVWFVASDNGARSSSTTGPLETEANTRLVHTVPALASFVMSQSKFLFGRRHEASGQTMCNLQLTGSIAEARFYSRELTAQEISASLTASVEGFFMEPPVSLQSDVRHRWSFDPFLASPLNDRVGTAHMSLVGPSLVQRGYLQVVCTGSQAGYAQTAVNVMSASTITAKTLEVFVKLTGSNPLGQRGGSALTVECPTCVSLGPSVFDAVVFGEAVSQQWYPGSDFGLRSFTGEAFETVANTQFVHVAIVYHSNSTITLYRNGAMYNSGRLGTSTVVTWVQSTTMFLMGLRHTTAGGDLCTRYLDAQMAEARVYYRALTPAELQTSYNTATYNAQITVVSATVPPLNNAASSQSVAWVLTLSAPVAQVDAGDFTSNLASITGVSSSGGGAVWTIAGLVNAQASDTMTLTLNANNGIIGATSNPVNFGSTFPLSSQVDRARPQPTFTTSSPAITNAATVTFTADFGETVTGVAVGSFTPTVGSASSVTPVSGAVYTIAIAIPSNANGVSLGVALSTAGLAGIFDSASNAVQAGAASPTVIVDRVAPVAVFSTQTASPSNAGSMTFSVDFGEDVMGFLPASVTATRGTVTGAGASLGTSVFVLTVTFDAQTPDGEVSLSLASGHGVTDLAGNAATNGGSPSIVLDCTPIAVLALTVVPGVAETVRDKQFDVEFSEVPVSFSTQTPALSPSNGAVQSVTPDSQNPRSFRGRGRNVNERRSGHIHSD